VRDRIDECVVLFVAAYLADEESRVQDQSEDQHEKKYDPENKQRDFTPVEQYPTDVQRDRQSNQARAERDEESY
jgi:hypothetical protein